MTPTDQKDQFVFYKNKDETNEERQRQLAEFFSEMENGGPFIPQLVAEGEMNDFLAQNPQYLEP